MSPIILYIEGNIGTGKSTFLKNLDNDDLKRKYNYDIIYEPVEMWQNVGILKKFYEDPERYCYLFQSYCLFTRFQLLDTINQNLDYVFIERSIFSDSYIFANTCKKLGQLNDIEFNIYNKWFTQFLSIHPTNYYHIYLQLDPKICLERINKRNRGEETSISLSYLQELHNAHETWSKKNRFIQIYNNKQFLTPSKVIEEIHYKIIGLNKDNCVLINSNNKNNSINKVKCLSI